MKKSALPVALVGGVVLSGTIGAQYASAASGEDAVKIAETHHEPYVYGSTDCSALTQKVYAQLGVNLPRTSAAQAGVGTPVSKSDLQPGDLVFFNTSGSGISHVGIYTGNGQMISAESSGIKQTGIFVGAASSYWGPKYVTARRVIGSGSGSTAVQASQQTAQSQTTNQQSQSSSSAQSAQPASQSQSSSTEQSNSQPATATSAASTTNTAAVSHSASAAATPDVYTVQNGDTLSAIEQKYNVSVATLKSINGLSSDDLSIGQKLKLKGQAAPEKAAAPKTSANTSTAVAENNVQKQAASSNGTYVVDAGDSLWLISKDKGISISKLKKINHLDSNIIYPGQKLTLTDQSVKKYAVKSGDTLWDIATYHGVTVKQLMSTNHLSSSLIHPDQQLVIPQ